MVEYPIHNMTTNIPTHTAKYIAERMRQDLEHAAEKAADYRTKAHTIRKQANEESFVPKAAIILKQAELNDAKADRWDAEFKVLENICITLTNAGV